MYKKNFPGAILPSILSSLYLKYPASAAAFHVSESSLSNWNLKENQPRISTKDTALFTNKIYNKIYNNYKQLSTMCG